MRALNIAIVCLVSSLIATPDYKPGIETSLAVSLFVAHAMGGHTLHAGLPLSARSPHPQRDRSRFDLGLVWGVLRAPWPSHSPPPGGHSLHRAARLRRESGSPRREAVKAGGAGRWRVVQRGL